MIYLPDAIGLVGVALTLVAYFLLQLRRIPSGFSYSLLNAIGSVCVIISLLFKFNPAAFLMEAIWFALSCYGLIQARKRHLH